MISSLIMSSSTPIPLPATNGNNHFAAVDIGTNSFKLTVVPTISAVTLDRAISAIRRFQHLLFSYGLPPSHLRLVATSAVREASNRSEFIGVVNEALGLHVEILSGAEEARLIYLGVLQFFPVFTSTVLTIDIGGGSTEFTVGFKGNVLLSISLRLGHVTLTQEFGDIVKMRDHIRNELENSGLIEKIKEFKIDVVIGSSGTIKAIEKAVCKGYVLEVQENVGCSRNLLKGNGSLLGTS
ncbi:UNVERIFIED_CONTAM: Exopolyphosphatase [Sesamum radiatum]|uniref:Exopolyphosphatase n=1 Tax=Sesamum radiatum TaxID=300843 RepID=A0AAW2RXG2_SESRA